MAAGSTGAITVGVFGDSLGDGIWAGLYRQLHAHKNVRVLRLSQASTGLTRYNYVDVQAKTVGQLDEHHIDIAVIMFGANDQQGIADGGQVYPFGSDGWRAVYGRRMDTLVNTLKRQGAAVYWVGLPKMERSRFDSGAALINAMQQQHMAALGVTFVPTVPLTVDAQGRYAAYLPDGDSDKRLMRANDGIHMSMAGYLRITAPVAALINRELAASASLTAGQTPPVTEPVTAPGAPVPAGHAPDAQP